MRIRWARSATKHRINRSRSEYVIEHCGLIYLEDASLGSGVRDQRLIYLGDDANGRPLEVMGVQLADEELLVIHAMSLRPKYQDDYQEAIRWRR